MCDAQNCHRIVPVCSRRVLKRRVEHCCEHPGCKAWGAWGFGRNKHEPPRWYCGKHKAEGERYL